MTVSDEAPAEAARRRLGLDVGELWVQCLALTGNCTRRELQLFLAGRGVLADHEYDVVAQALNDGFVEMGEGYAVPYAADLAHRSGDGAR